MSSCAGQVSYVPCGCKAHLSEKDPRAIIWRLALGCLEFPLQHPISHWAQAKDGEKARFLKGDWKALSEKQKEGILVEMRAKFRINTSIFQNQIRALGYMPIKDENIRVVTCELHFRCMQ